MSKIIREKYETTTDWLRGRYAVETGSKFKEEAELERLYDYDETADMRPDERGHFMESVFAELHPELYHSENEIFFPSSGDRNIGISPDFLDNEYNPKIAVELKCFSNAHHKAMYDKWKAKEDIFQPKTNRGLSEQQRRLLHQVQQYFKKFDSLKEVRLTFFSPFAKNKEMREFYFSYDYKILEKENN